MFPNNAETKKANSDGTALADDFGSTGNCFCCILSVLASFYIKLPE